MHLGLAFRCFFRALRDDQFANQVEPLLAKPSLEDKKPSGEALRLLAILQRDGRLLDFLTEDIKDYADDQIGAAVRDIHRDCSAALNKYLELAPVMTQSEGDKVQVQAGFDPQSVRLTGNVAGSPPFTGTLAHRGWRAKAIHLPETAPGSDTLVLAPAEVEIP